MELHCHFPQQPGEKNNKTSSRAWREAAITGVRGWRGSTHFKGGGWGRSRQRCNCLPLRAAGTKAPLLDVSQPESGRGGVYLHPAPCTGDPASRPPSAQSVETQRCNRPGFGETNGTHRLPIGAGPGAPKQDGDGRGLPPTLGGICRDRARSVPWPAPSRNPSCPWQAEVRASLGLGVPGT